MKRFKLNNSLIISFMLTVMLSPSAVFAVNMNAGANLWYAWLYPGFKEDFMGKNESTSYANRFSMYEPASLVYGCLLGAQLDKKLSLGCVLSYGTGWKCKTDYYYTSNSYEIHLYKDLDKIERLEGDLTLNYALNNIFKVFVGWKYLGEYGEGDYYYYWVYDVNTIYRGGLEVQFDATGPGAGVSAVVNVLKNTYLISTVSALGLASRTKTRVTGASSERDKETAEYLGGNGTATLAYVVPKSKVTVSLGGRYQYLRNIDDDTEVKFYGVLLTAIYSFNI